QALEQAELVWSDTGSGLTSGESATALFKERLASGAFFTHLTKDALGQSSDSETTISATYELPFQAHATMEPMNCTARLSGGRCEIWAPTQGVEMTQTVAAQVTGLPSDRITVHRTLIGGGFGRRLLADWVKEALLVAMAVKRPVKLIWS